MRLDRTTLVVSQRWERCSLLRAMSMHNTGSRMSQLSSRTIRDTPTALHEHSAADVQTPDMDRLAKRGVLFTPGLRFGTGVSVASGVEHGATPSEMGSQEQFCLRTSRWHASSCGDTQEAWLRHGEIREERLWREDDASEGCLCLSTEPRIRRVPRLLRAWSRLLSAHRRYPEADAPTRSQCGCGADAAQPWGQDFANGYLTEIFTDTAIDTMQQERGQPFYLTLSYNAVHRRSSVAEALPRQVRGEGNSELRSGQGRGYAKWFNQYITLGRSPEEMRGEPGASTTSAGYSTRWTS